MRAALLLLTVAACKPVPTCSEPVNCPARPDDEIRVCCAYECWWEVPEGVLPCNGFGNCDGAIYDVASMCGLSENTTALENAHERTTANTPRDEYPESQVGP